MVECFVFLRPLGLRLVKTLILSIVPGIGHIYVGDTNRGLIFFAALAALGFSESFIRGGQLIFGSMNSFIKTISIIVWIYQVLDAQLTLSKIANGRINLLDEREEKVRNNELIATLLSVIPGLGHFYIGRKRKGEQLFVIFLISYLAAAIISIDIVQLALPVVVIYSILDVKNQSGSLKGSFFNNSDSGSGLAEHENISFDRIGKVVGVILIVGGVFLIADRIALELFDREVIRRVKDYATLAFSSLIIIGIGIKLLISTGSSKSS